MTRFVQKAGYLHEPLELDDYIWPFGSWQSVKTMYGKTLRDMFHLEASVGYGAPNVPVLAYKDRSQRHLLDYKKSGRPLVLNFGSCS